MIMYLCWKTFKKINFTIYFGLTIFNNTNLFNCSVSLKINNNLFMWTIYNIKEYRFKNSSISNEKIK